MLQKLKHTFEKILILQYRLCRIFDRLFPSYMRIWGYREFVLKILPSMLEPGLMVVDVGGGKRPVITRAQKNLHQLKVIGLDLSAEELALAPEGIYDQTLVANICNLTQAPMGDLVIALAVLEHVRDTDSAMKNIAAIVRPGGRALVFVPCRNSLFARLNLALPEWLKRKLLDLFFGRTSSQQGFKSFYNLCSPAELKKLAQKHGLEVEEEICYFQSAYFTMFLPLHVIYRLVAFLLVKIIGNQAAETFTLVLRRPGSKKCEDAISPASIKA